MRPLDRYTHPQIWRGSAASQEKLVELSKSALFGIF